MDTNEIKNALIDQVDGTIAHLAPRDVPGPPAHLSSDSKRLWTTLIAEYDLDPAALRVLRLACEALDRCEGARRELAKHKSVTYTDRFNAPRLHPLVSVERDARLAAGRLLNQLGLQPDQQHEPLALRPRRRDHR